MKRTSYANIQDAEDEEALLSLIPGVVDVHDHSTLVESLEADPKRFYIDTRSGLTSGQQGKLNLIARRIVYLLELRSFKPSVLFIRLSDDDKFYWLCEEERLLATFNKLLGMNIVSGAANSIAFQMGCGLEYRCEL